MTLPSNRQAINGTTKRFHRSLADAFPDVRANSVEHYHMPRFDIVKFLAVCALLALLAVGVQAI